ncbi:MAG: transporter [Bacteriovorax sp.]|nr:transporter [Rhizobacter sp.]
MRAVRVLVGLACLPLMHQAQAEEPIATDRPDFVESSDVVGKGRFQLETSVAFERDRQAGLSTRLRSTPTLLRWGISEDWELRLETEGALRLRSSGPGGVTTESGFGDVSLGAKWHWREGNEEAGTPGMAWLFHVDVDSGSAAFRGPGLRPSIRMVAEWELVGGYSFGVMPGVYTDRNDAGQRYVGGIFAVVLGKSLTDKLRGFVELSGQQLAARKNGGNLLTFDTGLAYLLSNDLQVDLALSRGLNKTSPDFSWTVGLSSKF